MKQLVFNTGGRPLANDDLETLQDEVYAAMQATLHDAPPMVLSGCQVTQSNGIGDIAPGFIWLAGSIQRYMGASGVAIPAEIVAGPYVESDIRPYQTGGSKACMQERELTTQAIGTAAAGTPRVTFIAAAELTYPKWLESRSRTMGEIQWLANVRGGDYSASGKGWSDLASRGWALCNGQNGTADLQGRFIVGRDPGQSDYDTIGKTGGENTVTLSVSQIPAHNHNDGTRNLVFGMTSGGNDTPQVDKSPGEPNVVTPGRLQSAGGGQAHENRPPFYVLAARQWIGF